MRQPTELKLVEMSNERISGNAHTHSLALIRERRTDNSEAMFVLDDN